MPTEIAKITATKGEWVDTANGKTKVTVATQITSEGVEEIGSYAIAIFASGTDLTALAAGEKDLAIKTDWKDITRNRDQGVVGVTIEAGEILAVQSFGDQCELKVVRS